MASKRIPGIVSTKWLAQCLNNKDVAVLDGTWCKPTSNRNPQAEFEQSHIQGARFFDIKTCRDKSSPYSNMLPTSENFARYVGNMGIGNQTHVVVYDNHETMGLFSAPRVWWMFRVFGHDHVSVLDGGFPKWKKESRPLTNKTDQVEQVNFKATFRRNLYRTFADMEENLSLQDFSVVDARSADRFNGVAPGYNKAIPPGRMPNAVNLPYKSLMKDTEKTMLSKEELSQLFQNVGAVLNQPMTATCGTGITACMLALAAYECGHHTMPVYDGSWEEWYYRAKQQHKIISDEYRSDEEPKTT